MKHGRAPLPQARPALAPMDPAGEAGQALGLKLQTALDLHQQGQLDQAEVLYKEILQVQPRHFDALQLLGTVAVQRNHSAEAIVLFELALKIHPEDASVLSNRGSALLSLKRAQEALDSCERALRVRPDYAEALSNRGNALRALGRPVQALESYDHALRIKPDHAEALSNRGAALRALNRHVEALDSYDRALRLKPAFAQALNNRGAALQDLNRHAEALESCARALQLEPGNVEAHWNEALCRLMLGDFVQGWQSYEWRWKRELNKNQLRKFPQALWLGKEALEGKTILLHAEQGLGDTLQFCRYAKEVAALGARVVLEVQPALKSLLQGLEGVSLLLGRGERLPDFDYHCPLLSLPLAFQVDLGNISGEPYLHSDPDKRQAWQERLGPTRNKRIGLVWSGSTGHQNDHNRSLALQDVKALLESHRQADYFSLQKEHRPADQRTLANTPGVQFLGESLEDFSDTAAVVAMMDLVITVDTSVAHLAGALGKEVWILLPFSPDWRWLLDRSDSPWYASARLFRQPAPGDWASVLGQVQAALRLRLAASPREPQPEPGRALAPTQKPPAKTVQDLAAQLAQAVSLHQQGQLDQAEALYKQILQVQPAHFDALQLLGMTEAQKNNPAAARVLFEQALKIHPQHAGALNNYGNVLRALKRPEEALASYDRALQLQPDYAEALVNRGNTLWELQRAEEALASYDLAVDIDPGNLEALGNRGSVLGDLKRPAQALESFDRVLEIRPDDAQVLCNRGNALLDLKRAEEAVASCDRALQVRPDFAEALSHRGNALRALNRNSEALESYDRALRIRPAYAEAWNNRGAALQDLNRHAEALESCARALQLEPGNVEAHWNEALCRLMLGDFVQGWQSYEWRWKRELNKNQLRKFPQALWLGKEALEGKTILLHAEQGLGDTLQFCRYAKEVAALGARVVLEVQPALKSLLQGLEGVSLLLGRGERLPDFDYHCPLLSLPLAFQVDLGNISGEPYLHSDPDKRQAWQERLGPTRNKRIGLVWSGSTGHQNDHNRSLALQDVKALLESHRQADYFSLQKEHRPADQRTLANTPGVQFLGESLEDFSDTAAVVAMMDLVITVDTSVAHLAGALGKEVWILLPFSPDWRWLLDRSDSPWYASARLFRQPTPGDWVSVLGLVQAALTLRLQ
ncbi:tetratricopeptide repeat protein [Polaromonas sp.]|uniref:tetratricopeptide repeat protein n=1 Tax=Polaromonas sp. TaxID=1869339 RepID=UPI00248A8DAD|nr:tetratricopeptide repeat protein [Polaromonas sp.]MDI1339083.1 tetratricopeptide repeat protein [Polaromonas sp.]